MLVLLLHTFIIFLPYLACGVSLYCWRGCFGVSGYLRSMAFSERATFKYSSLKLFLSFNPSDFMISAENMYVSPIHLTRVSTCWLNLWGTCGVLEDSLRGTCGVPILGCSFQSSVGRICKYLFLRTQPSFRSKFLKKRTR